MTELTDKQAETFGYILKCVYSGLPPTLAEIAEYHGISKFAAQDRVHWIAKKGWIVVNYGKYRGISVCRRG
jgi:hypothetical protein